MSTVARARGFKNVASGIDCRGVRRSLAVAYAGISLFTADRLTRSTNHPSAFDPRHVGCPAHSRGRREHPTRSRCAGGTSRRASGDT